jgi:hypothetical protein
MCSDLLDMEQKRSLESNDFSSWNSENFIKPKDIE